MSEISPEPVEVVEKTAGGVEGMEECTNTEDPTTKYSKKYVEEYGDFTIISSDGVAFSVHTYMLQAHSKTLRDLIASPSSRKRTHEGDPKTLEIELTDEEFEDSDTLNWFFDIIYGQRLQTHYPEFIYDTIDCLPARLFRLANKYDCQIVMETLSSHFVRCAIQGIEGCCPLIMFILAAQLEMPILCSAILRGPLRKLVWKNDQPRGVQGAYKLHPAAMPWDHFKLLPTPYHFYLQRALIDSSATPSAPFVPTNHPAGAFNLQPGSRAPTPSSTPNPVQVHAHWDKAVKIFEGATKIQGQIPIDIPTNLYTVPIPGSM
ncbi:hypothetical protein M231_00844 [Tremella mesenterica]|uniref:BTB domain-containing protein n=1 Tax=Tremella mesenterica TaxID=5217 RepID=A0A4Q1BUS5_TREME|nr:uncharacterized protein TREMEDRAFT_65806 [Tremella mesenterica DSM 1558]EIW66200.1 hypothetical protein TREMEDRAFT_65806 [Tremella mesenterica DSM 1558]RXK41845.1 hypothetical protein M231_00844 [Tremella mesenterica]